MWGLHFRAPHASFYFMELSRVSILIFFLQSARLNDADENCKKNIFDADFDLKNKQKKTEDVCSIRVTSGTTDILISDSFNVANKLCQFS